MQEVTYLLWLTQVRPWREIIFFVTLDGESIYFVIEIRARYANVKYTQYNSIFDYNDSIILCFVRHYLVVKHHGPYH